MALNFHSKDALEACTFRVSPDHTEWMVQLLLILFTELSYYSVHNNYDAEVIKVFFLIYIVDVAKKTAKVKLIINHRYDW